MRFGEICVGAQGLFEIFLCLLDLSGSQREAAPLEQCNRVLRILLQGRGQQTLRSLELPHCYICGEKTASGSQVVRILFGELFKLGQSGIPFPVVVEKQSVLRLEFGARKRRDLPVCLLCLTHTFPGCLRSEEHTSE